MLGILSMSVAFGFSVLLFGQFVMVGPVTHHEMNEGMGLIQCQSACLSLFSTNSFDGKKQDEIQYPQPKPGAYYLLAPLGFVYLGKIIVTAYQLRRLNWQPPDPLATFSVSRT